MTKESLAKLMDGREYANEISYGERAEAKAVGLVVLIGGSDDLACFHGAIDDEAGAPGDIYLTPDGLLADHDDDCECKFCGFKDAQAKARKIEAIWSEESYSWTYKTDLPHATFDIVEGDEKYCRGIVFSISDLEVPTNV